VKFPEAISREQTVEILSGSRDIPPEVTQGIGNRIETRKPLVNPDAFNEFAKEHIERVHRPDIREIAQDTVGAIIKLGSTSVFMAHMLAGSVGIPRPRRLGEHNQSVTNVYESTFGKELGGGDDTFLRLFLTVFQDGGKSYGLAIDGNTKRQKKHNYDVLQNILPHVDALTKDQKRVMELVLVRDMLGRAIFRHHDLKHSLEEVMSEAEGEMSELRRALPGKYKDKADIYVDALYRADAGAHTQHPAARYIDPKTGKMYSDVTNQDKRTLDKYGYPATLDRIFSQSPRDRGKLRFHRPEDLEVVERLLPSLYGKKR
jgi:hypothetical protein